MAKYQLRYFFEWGSGCLWPQNEAAYTDFGIPISLGQLPLSEETQMHLDRMEAWHQTALNWSSPTDPGPWREAECERFNRAAKALLVRIRSELGEEFEVVNDQPEYQEDPELDAYLNNPQHFRRQSL